MSPFSGRITQIFIRVIRVHSCISDEYYAFSQKNQKGDAGFERCLGSADYHQYGAFLHTNAILTNNLYNLYNKIN